MVLSNKAEGRSVPLRRRGAPRPPPPHHHPTTRPTNRQPRRHRRPKRHPHRIPPNRRHLPVRLITYAGTEDSDHDDVDEEDGCGEDGCDCAEAEGEEGGEAGGETVGAAAEHEEGDEEGDECYAASDGVEDKCGGESFVERVEVIVEAENFEDLAVNRETQSWARAATISSRAEPKCRCFRRACAVSPNTERHVAISRGTSEALFQLCL